MFNCCQNCFLLLNGCFYFNARAKSFQCWLYNDTSTTHFDRRHNTQSGSISIITANNIEDSVISAFHAYSWMSSCLCFAFYWLLDSHTDSNTNRKHFYDVNTIVSGTYRQCSPLLSQQETSYRKELLDWKKLEARCMCSLGTWVIKLQWFLLQEHVHLFIVYWASACTHVCTHLCEIIPQAVLWHKPPESFWKCRMPACVSLMLCEQKDRQ